MPRVRTNARAHQSPTPAAVQVEAPLDDGTVALALIQALIPLGLQAVEDALQQEVLALTGARYAHDDGHPGMARWGRQRGSVYLADQKLPITVPRVRDVHAQTEVPLATYAQWQTPRAHDVGLFRRMLSGISTRENEAAAEAVPEAFGLSKSSVSRRFGQASAAALAQFQTRRHDDRQWLVLLLDGKTFAEDQVVIALGVTTEGEKRTLGLVQTATENKRTCATFLRELIERLRGAARLARRARRREGPARRGARRLCHDAVVQRCQWHKRENVLRYLTKPEQVRWRRKLRDTYAHGGYEDAKRALQRLVKELAVRGDAAAH